MKYKLYLIAIFSIVILSSQTKKSRRQISIEKEVQKKIALFRKSKNERCAQRVMDRAIEIVDSTLLIQAKLKLSNSVERPTKPDKPETKNAKDTLPVKPLFE